MVCKLIVYELNVFFPRAIFFLLVREYRVWKLFSLVVCKLIARGMNVFFPEQLFIGERSQSWEAHTLRRTRLSVSQIAQLVCADPHL